MTDLPPCQALCYDELLTRFLELEQRVNDLQAQLASHETAPYPHGRYFMGAIGEIVLDGLTAALDYDPTGEMDTPILDDAQADACELIAAQRERIWARVVGANGNGA